MTDLGRLEKVDLRSVWPTEDQDFTPWLAQEGNLEILGNTIGIELELEAQEKDVGPFKLGKPVFLMLRHSEKPDI